MKSTVISFGIVLLLAASSLAAPMAQAELISIDINSNGDGFTDTTTGLEWVKLSNTSLNFDTLMQQYTNFELAKHDQVDDLIQRYFFDLFDASSEIVSGGINSEDIKQINTASGQLNFQELINNLITIGGKVELLDEQHQVHTPHLYGRAFGFFESKYNNLGNVDIRFREIYEYIYEMTPDEFIVMQNHDSVRIALWEPALMVSLDNLPQNPYISNGGYFLVRTIPVPEPTTLSVIGIALFAMFRLGQKKP